MEDKAAALTQAEIDHGMLTPEVMWKMGRIGGFSLSPDGAATVFAVTRYDMQENKGRTSLYIQKRGGEPELLTADASDPSWSGDGKSVYFTSGRSGATQLWSIDPATGHTSQVTDVAGGIESYGVARSGDRMFYTKAVEAAKRRSSQIYPDLDKSKALIYDDLMVRHWDYWDEGLYRHIFVAPVVDGRMGEAVDIMPGEEWDAPTAPYFDASEIAWNNAGTQLAYTCKKMTGAQYAVSTDSDIYLYDVETGSTRNMTEGMEGYDKYPAFSPDGSRLAFTSMATPGYEADRERLMVIDIATGGITQWATRLVGELTRDFDYSAQHIAWGDGDTIYFIAPMQGTLQLCRAEADGSVRVLTRGDHDINSFSMASGRIVAGVTTLSSATELYDIDAASGEMARTTDVNGNIYSNIRMGRVEKRWIPTTDGKKMLTWVVYPPDFDPAKRYPALLYCQGGPQSVVSQSWSYRWNLQLMASQGYIVVAPNRRGTPSFGQEWLQQISGDYSGQNIRDYLSAIDNVSAEEFVDSERLGCVGASYGGYSAFYLMGHHDKRFKAFIAHCGIFDFESMYGSTEELWFVNYDYGGPYWEKNPVAQRSYANSPHKAVDKWDTPILIITGLKDYRIPYSQSLEAFTAARLRGLDARLVAFEDEAHQVFKPQNSIAWNREFFGWLDKYLGAGR